MLSNFLRICLLQLQRRNIYLGDRATKSGTRPAPNEIKMTNGKFDSSLFFASCSCRPPRFAITLAGSVSSEGRLVFYGFSLHVGSFLTAKRGAFPFAYNRFPISILREETRKALLQKRSSSRPPSLMPRARLYAIVNWTQSTAWRAVALLVS